MRDKTPDSLKKPLSDQRTVGNPATSFVLLGAVVFIFLCGLQPAMALTSPLMHSSANLGTKYGNWGTAYDCSTCHNRTTTNIKRINQAINTPLGARPVVFSRLTTVSGNNVTTGVFGNDLRSYNQNGSQNVCEVCHHQTLHHQYSSAKIADRTTNPHYNNQDCAGTCHPHSAGFKGAGCDGCHGNPPITSSIGGGALNGLASPATGATSPASPGAHQQHAIDMGMKCATCHSNTVMPTVNNMIYMGFAANPANVRGFVGSFAYGSYTGHTLAAPYTGYAAAPGTAVGVSATSYQNSCNVYCHGNWTGNGGFIGNPSWVGGAGQGACGTCHGTTQANPPTRASHPKHVTTYGYGCTKCHPNATNTKSHVQGTVQWRMSTAVNGIVSSGATYTANGQAAAATGTTGTLAPSSIYGTCNNLYCHSNGQNLATPGAPRTVPQWGSTLTCSDCHGNSNTTLTSGSHAKHVASAGCDKCHYLTATNANTIKNTANHVSGTINVAFKISTSAVSGAQYGGVATPRTKTPDGGASYGSCTSIICHANGQSVWSNTVGTGTTPTWGTVGGCGACHGNATYTDYRKAAPLYATGSPKPNAHAYHTDSRATTSGLEPQCANCHSSVTATNTAIDGTTPANHANNVYNAVPGATFRDADQYGTSTAPVTVTLTYAYNGSPGTSTCANVSCHPTGLNDANKAATVVAWNDKYQCADCHKVDLTKTTGYHHAMRNYSASSAAYPTAVPQGDATTGTNSNSRRCTMCHVDHRISSPLQNSSNTIGRAANLRTGISTVPTTTTGYTNSDYVGTAGGSGGICISCHNSQLTKSTSRIMVEASSTKTVDIVFGDYSRGAHQYAIASVMKSPDSGGTFNSNCTKCHNGRVTDAISFSGMTTAIHDNAKRRNYASLGGTKQVDGNDAWFCYGCHNGASTKDYYNTATMSARSKDTYNSFSTATRVYRHNVDKYNGLHRPSSTDETLTYIAANKHVTCTDCHDPHAARFGNHSTSIVRSNTALAKVLRGALGTRYAKPAAWTKPTQASYSSLRPVTREYQICFKCHSGAIDTGTSWFRNMTTNSLGSKKWTDLGLEFNPNNKSFHPVVASLSGSASTTLGTAGGTTGMANGWKNGDIMTCSDCHATDSAASRGPHGSSVKWMLAGVNKAWPYTSAASNGGTTGTFWTITNRTTGQGTVNGLFCLNCHSSTLLTPHTSDTAHQGIACVNCHIRVPHGGKVSRLIGANSSGALPKRYYPDGNGGGTPYILKFTKGSYSTSSCYVTNASCSAHNSSTNGSETW